MLREYILCVFNRLDGSRRNMTMYSSSSCKARESFELKIAKRSDVLLTVYPKQYENKF